MAGLFSGLDEMRKTEWFEQFLYIINKHWNRVDNFRIDKFLALIRFYFNALLEFLIKAPKHIEWYQRIMFNYFLKTEDNSTAVGIALQICDVLVCELNKVASDLSLDKIAQLLEPFLRCLG